MRSVAPLVSVLCAVSACSPPSTVGAGGGDTTVPWTPGRYAMEATVGTGSITDQEFRAVLTVAPDGSMSLDSSTGLCQAPPPPAVGQQQALGQRTFQCGDAVYTVRPTPSGVRGNLRASVLEEYPATVPCPIGSAAQRVCTIMRTRRVTRNADLTVSSLN